LYNSTRGDKTQLSATPLSWLLVAPGSPKFDSFPRHLFVAYISLVLGLPIPTIAGDPKGDVRGQRCTCAARTPRDPQGHHILTCKTLGGATFKRGHDHVVLSLVDAARTLGTSCTAQPKAVPTHTHSRKQGDILFESVLASGQHVVADVTVCHPVLGSPQSPSGVIGSWQKQAMGARYAHKLHKHRDYYNARCLEFVPLVVSTFGVLHADFARLLWLLASPARDPTLAVGEVREAGPLASRRHLFFYKLHSRMAVMAARAAAQRLDGMAYAPGRLPFATEHVPTDPAFAYVDSLAPLHIGPVTQGGVGG
jgi:hypothetical protein